MKYFFDNVRKSFLGAMCASVLLALPLSALADGHGHGDDTNVRAMATQVEAVVVNVDLEHRQVSLQGPMGQILTVRATEKVVKLEDVNVGDVLVVTYIAALEGELREPTEEELANPWLEVDSSAISEDPAAPAVGEARIVRSVCTIEGMNRILGTVVIKDARGIVHVIDEVEPEKMEGVTLGQTIVMVYREAVALSLEHKPQPAE